jgi:ribA/ribD-fused uncharacterized protein
MTNTIYGFDGDNRWLSNFWVEADGSTNEHWFQALKATDSTGHAYIMSAKTPEEAKQRGREAALHEDWESFKDLGMLRMLHRKFQDPQLREKLLATGDARLVEANTWNDRYWGVDKESGVGENMLGILLQQVRDEIRNGYV